MNAPQHDSKPYGLFRHYMKYPFSDSLVGYFATLEEVQSAPREADCNYRLYYNDSETICPPLEG